MSKQKDLLKNTLIIALGKISTQFISFLLLPLYTSFLTPGDFGLVDIITTYVVLFAPVITVQLEMAAFRYLIDARASEQEKAKVITNVVHLVGVLTLIFAALYMIVSAFIAIPFGYLVLLSIAATIFANLFLQF